MQISRTVFFGFFAITIAGWILGSTGFVLDRPHSFLVEVIVIVYGVSVLNLIGYILYEEGCNSGYHKALVEQLNKDFPEEDNPPQ